MRKEIHVLTLDVFTPSIGCFGNRETTISRRTPWVEISKFLVAAFHLGKYFSLKFPYTRFPSLRQLLGEPYRYMLRHRFARFFRPSNDRSDSLGTSMKKRKDDEPPMCLNTHLCGRKRHSFLHRISLINSKSLTRTMFRTPILILEEYDRSV